MASERKTPGSKITQHELAHQLGVSRSTVAAALNPASTIKLKETTRERIIKAAERLNYRPDHYARIMRGGRSGAIGILHFGGLLQVAAERAFHAANAVRREGYNVVSADLSWSSADIEAACSSLIDARVEGVIVAGMNIPSAVAELERVKEAGIPVVTLSGNPLPWAPHFRGDTRRGIHDLTEHLLGLGHRQLCLLSHISTGNDPGAYVWAGQERLLGFQAALEQAGGKLVKNFTARPKAPQGMLVRTENPADAFNPFEPGITGMRAILRQRLRPSAVLCSNDEVAFGAMKVCREEGVSIPGEIALTGYDDTSLGQYCEVPLTTVRQPNRAMGEAALEALLKLIRGEEIPPEARLLLFPCQVIVRSSTGGPVGPKR